MEARVQKLQEVLRQEALDAYYVTNLYNIRYLSGFTGTTATVLITQEDAYFFTDFRYEEQAHEQCVGFKVIIAGGSAAISDPLAYMADLIQKLPQHRVGFEADDLTVKAFKQVTQKVACEWIEKPGLVQKLREVKDQEEIKTIKTACDIAVEAFSYIVDFIEPGQTEIEIANALDFKMREMGASGVSFTTIIASGLRSAMPHGVASEKVVEKGDLITLDYGCYYHGYASDMTRTVAIGEPKAELRKIYDIVYEANRRVNEAARPGLTGKELDAVARDYIKECGYGEQFGHSTGHSVGLEVHEAPMVSFRSEEVFVPGNVITNEPGIYVEGLGGVRIEDDILITEEGGEIFTPSPRELLII